MTLFAADFINSIEAVANIFYLIEQNVDEPEAVRELLRMAQPAWKRVVDEILKEQQNR